MHGRLCGMLAASTFEVLPQPHAWQEIKSMPATALAAVRDGSVWYALAPAAGGTAGAYRILVFHCQSARKRDPGESPECSRGGANDGFEVAGVPTRSFAPVLEACDGVTDLAVQVHSVDPPHPWILRSIELTARKAAPAFGWRPERDQSHRAKAESVA